MLNEKTSMDDILILFQCQKKKSFVIPHIVRKLIPLRKHNSKCLFAFLSKYFLDGLDLLDFPFESLY